MYRTLSVLASYHEQERLWTELRNARVALETRSAAQSANPLIREYRTRLIADVVTGQARRARGGGEVTG